MRRPIFPAVTASALIFIIALCMYPSSGRTSGPDRKGQRQVSPSHGAAFILQDLRERPCP
jgi:hypothetical protein